MSARKKRLEQRCVYVGNLHKHARVKDIVKVFKPYGKILDINLINRNGSSEKKPFAFITFEDARDAQDAIEYRDGYTLLGRKLRVEFAYAGDYSWKNGTKHRYQKPSYRLGAKYRVIVTGLPESASWQDLKDHMRPAGNIGHSDIFKDGSGLIAYYKRGDMQYAIRKLDDTKFHSHKGESSYITVRAQTEGITCSLSRSRSGTPDNRLRDTKSRSESPGGHSPAS